MMKKILLTFAILLLNFAVSEAQSVKPEDLKTPDSPGFQILDISPTSIEKPINPKALGATLLSLANDGNAIPKNFAMEVSPYWYLKDSNASVLKYLNIRNDDKPTVSFSGILSKLSISMASVYSDTTNGSLIAKTNYLSFGARTNLFTYRLSKQNIYLKGTLAKISNKIVELKPKEIITDNKESEIRKLKTDNLKLKEMIVAETDDLKKESFNRTLKENSDRIQKLQDEVDSIEENAPDIFLKVLKEDEELKSYMDELDTPPLIQIDGAFAYSEAFSDNTTANKRFNRSGVWTSIAVNSSGMAEKKSKYNLAAVGLFKYISDNMLIDNENNIFGRENALDIGIKVDFTIKDFTLAYEHIKRNYNGNNGLDSNRNVFIMQYKISDGLYFTGSYGKNFGEINNLFSLFGINYGFGKTQLKVSE